MYVMGLDIGYGYIKGVHGEGNISRSFISPTATSKYVPEISFGEQISTVQVNGEKFAVGEIVKSHGLNNGGTVRDDFVGTNDYLAIIAASLSRSMIPPVAVLVLGLPPAQCSKAKAAELTSLIGKIKMADHNGSPIATPPVVKVIPQGVGIFFSHVMNGHDADFMRSVTVLDVGYRTLDIVSFQNGKYLDTAAMSYSLGVMQIYEEVTRLHQKQHGTFPKADSLEDLLRYGKYRHCSNDYELAVTDIKTNYINRVLRTVKEYARETNRKADAVIVGGGGITLLGGVTGGVVVENPQFGNAKGYYEYGKQVKVPVSV